MVVSRRNNDFNEPRKKYHDQDSAIEILRRIGGSRPDLGRSDVAGDGVSIKRYADEIRAYCSLHYVQPARVAGKKEISIRAGDVHEAMGYKNRMPLVCSAIGTARFSEQNGVRRIAVEGPLNGANTVFRFKLS